MSGVDQSQVMRFVSIDVHDVPMQHFEIWHVDGLPVKSSAASRSQRARWTSVSRSTA